MDGEDEERAPVTIPRRIPHGPVHVSGVPFRLWCLMSLLAQAVGVSLNRFEDSHQYQQEQDFSLEWTFQHKLWSHRLSSLKKQEPSILTLFGTILQRTLMQVITTSARTKQVKKNCHGKYTYSWPFVNPRFAYFVGIPCRDSCTLLASTHWWMYLLGEQISAKHLLSMGMVFAHWISNEMKPMFFV